MGGIKPDNVNAPDTTRSLDKLYERYQQLSSPQAPSPSSTPGGDLDAMYKQYQQLGGPVGATPADTTTAQPAPESFSFTHARASREEQERHYVEVAKGLLQRPDVDPAHKERIRRWLANSGGTFTNAVTDEDRSWISNLSRGVMDMLGETPYQAADLATAVVQLPFRAFDKVFGTSFLPGNTFRENLHESMTRTKEFWDPQGKAGLAGQGLGTFAGGAVTFGPINSAAARLVIPALGRISPALADAVEAGLKPGASFAQRAFSHAVASGTVDVAQAADVMMNNEMYPTWDAKLKALGIVAAASAGGAVFAASRAPKGDLGNASEIPLTPASEVKQALEQALTPEEAVAARDQAVKNVREHTATVRRRAVSDWNKMTPIERVAKYPELKDQADLTFGKLSKDAKNQLRNEAEASIKDELGVTNIEQQLKDTKEKALGIVRRMRKQLADERAERRKYEELSYTSEKVPALGNFRAFEKATSHPDAMQGKEIVFIDLKALKETNESFGHKGGDLRLNQVGFSMADVAEAMGVDARNLFHASGDEFLAVVPQGSGKEFLQRVTDHFGEVENAPGLRKSKIEGEVAPSLEAADEKLRQLKINREQGEQRIQKIGEEPSNAPSMTEAVKNINNTLYELAGNKGVSFYSNVKKLIASVRRAAQSISGDKAAQVEGLIKDAEAKLEAAATATDNQFKRKGLTPADREQLNIRAEEVPDDVEALRASLRDLRAALSEEPPAAAKPTEPVKPAAKPEVPGRGNYPKQLDDLQNDPTASFALQKAAQVLKELNDAEAADALEHVRNAVDKGDISIVGEEGSYADQLYSALKAHTRDPADVLNEIGYLENLYQIRRNVSGDSPEARIINKDVRPGDTFGYDNNKVISVDGDIVKYYNNDTGQIDDIPLGFVEDEFKPRPKVETNPMLIEGETLAENIKLGDGSVVPKGTQLDRDLIEHLIGEGVVEFTTNHGKVHLLDFEEVNSLIVEYIKSAHGLTGLEPGQFEKFLADNPSLQGRYHKLYMSLTDMFAYIIEQGRSMKDAVEAVDSRLKYEFKPKMSEELGKAVDAHTEFLKYVRQAYGRDIFREVAEDNSPANLSPEDKAKYASILSNLDDALNNVKREAGQKEAVSKLLTDVNRMSKAEADLAEAAPGSVQEYNAQLNMLRDRVMPPGIDKNELLTRILDNELSGLDPEAKTNALIEAFNGKAPKNVVESAAIQTLLDNGAIYKPFGNEGGQGAKVEPPAPTAPGTGTQEPAVTGESVGKPAEPARAEAPPKQGAEGAPSGNQYGTGDLVTDSDYPIFLDQLVKYVETGSAKSLEAARVTYERFRANGVDDAQILANILEKSKKFSVSESRLKEGLLKVSDLFKVEQPKQLKVDVVPELRTGEQLVAAGLARRSPDRYGIYQLLDKEGKPTAEVKLTDIGKDKVHIGEIAAMRPGGGSEAMQALVDFADAGKLTLVGKVKPFEPLQTLSSEGETVPVTRAKTKEELFDWYNKFGFEKKANDEIIRKPTPSNPQEFADRWNNMPIEERKQLLENSANAGKRFSRLSKATKEEVIAKLKGKPKTTREMVAEIDRMEEALDKRLDKGEITEEEWGTETAKLGEARAILNKRLAVDDAKADVGEQPIEDPRLPNAVKYPLLAESIETLRTAQEQAKQIADAIVKNDYLQEIRQAIRFKKDLTEFDDSKLLAHKREVQAMLQNASSDEKRMIADRFAEVNTEIARREGQNPINNLNDRGGSIRAVPDPWNDDLSVLTTDERTIRDQMVIGHKLDATWHQRLSAIKDSPSASFHELVYNLRRSLERGILPLEKADLRTGQWAQMFSGWVTRAEQFLFEQPFIMKNDGSVEFLNVKPLAKIVGPLGRLTNKFRVLSLAKRALEVPEKVGIDRAVAMRVVENADPKMLQAVEEATAYDNATLLYAVHGGMVKGKLAEMLIDLYKSFAPIHRVFEGEEVVIGPKGEVGVRPRITELVGPRKVLYRLTGGKAKILDPIQARVENTRRIIRETDLNRSVLSLYEAVQRDPESYRGIAEIETKKRIVLGHEAKKVYNEMAKILKAQGKPVDEETLKDLVALGTRNRLGKGNDTVVGFKDGKRIVMRVSPDIAEAIQSMSPERMAWWVQMIGVPTRAFKTGVVLQPLFPPLAFLKDAVEGVIRSKYGMTPWGPFRGLGIALSDTKLAKMLGVTESQYLREYRAGGGAYSALSAAEARTTTAAMRYTLREGRAAPLLHPIDALKRYARPFEEAVRLEEFRLARLQGKSVLEAAVAGRNVTIDFNQAGGSMQALNHMIPFLNPAIQSLATDARILRQQPARVAAIGAAMALGTWMWMAANDDDQQLNDLRKTPYGELFLWGRLPDGTIYKLPKPYFWGQVFMTSAEYAWDKLKHDDPDAAARWRQATWNGAWGIGLPAIGQLYMGLKTNKVPLTGAPIVPETMQDLEPQFQITPNTSFIGRKVGKLLNVSPMNVDFVISQSFGSLGRDALNAVNIVDRANREMPTPVNADLPVVGRLFGRYPAGNVEPIYTFYNHAGRAEQVANSVRYLSTTKPDELPDYVKKNLADVGLSRMYAGARSTMADMRESIKRIEQVQGMSREEKRQLVDGITEAMIELARQANEVDRQVRSAINEQPPQ